MPTNERNTTVLLVDDEDASRYAVGRMLKKAGFTVREAGTCRDALREAREQIDIIVLDVNLPDGSGYDACRTLKSDPATAMIPVVHLSASYVRAEDRAYGLNHGAEGYLTHPVEEVVLVATLNALLRFRRAEAALTESEARYRTLVAVVPALIFTAGPDGDWTYVNPQWCQHTGHGSEAVLRSGWPSYVHPADAADAVAWWRNVTASADDASMEFRIRDALGAYRWFACRVAPRRDASGAVQQWFGACSDIEPQKRAAEAFREAATAKDRFLAVLSHELRTPLTPVLAAAQAIESDPEPSAAVRETAAMITRNVELEVRLIDDLLDITRITKGKLRLAVQPTDAHRSILDVVDICKSDLNAKRIDLDYRLDAVPAVVNADPARFQQVLWNLVKNAVKFTPEHGRIAIETANPTADQLMVTVTDNGVGIPAEVLPHIFDAFEQGGELVTRQFGGMGLGLTISKAVADLHGGALTARSGGAGKGASFSLTLPVSAGLPAASDRRADDGARASASGGKRVLLVEDHADTAKVMARFLRLWGYQVETASTAAAALDAASRGTFDLMISDIGLPDQSGLLLMRRIRERHAFPAIALSGYGTDDDVRQARDAGFVEHIVKPVSTTRLHSAVARVLGGGPAVP